MRIGGEYSISVFPDVDNNNNVPVPSSMFASYQSVAVAYESKY